MNKKIETKSFNQQQELKTWEVEWEWKGNEPQGVLQGWANVYEKAGKIVVDRGRDSIKRGALKKSVKIPILINHDTKLPVGVGIAYEKSNSKGDYGIYIEIKLFLDSPSQMLRERALEAWSLAKSGVLDKLSIGFIVHDYDIENAQDKRPVRVIKLLELLETSLVVVPMNRESLLESVKAAQQAAAERIIPGTNMPALQLEDAIAKALMDPQGLMIYDYLCKGCGQLSNTKVPRFDMKIISREPHLKEYFRALVELVDDLAAQELMLNTVEKACILSSK